MPEYSKEVLFSIYELGRMYFELGYFAPAERIFAGLTAMDEGMTPGQIGLGLIKLEGGLYKEAIVCFREALEKGAFRPQAQLALASAFVGSRDYARARSILSQVERDAGGTQNIEAEMRTLWEALVMRCQSGE